MAGQDRDRNGQNCFSTIGVLWDMGAFESAIRGIEGYLRISGTGIYGGGALFRAHTHTLWHVVSLPTYHLLSPPGHLFLSIFI